MTNKPPPQHEPSETTGLLLSAEEEQEEPPVTVTSNVLGGTYIQENEPVGPCCYNCFKYFHMITALVPAFMMVAQIVAWIFVPSTGYMEMILRSYVIVFCILFIQAELRIGAQSGIINITPLNNWMYRGFLYTFVGIIGTEMSLAALGQFYPELPGFEGMLVSLILKSSSYAMIGLGVLYMLMSVFCLQKVFQGAEQAHQERLVEQLAETNAQQEENAV
jgi:hypothetical protein